MRWRLEINTRRFTEDLYLDYATYSAFLAGPGTAYSAVLSVQATYTCVNALAGCGRLLQGGSTNAFGLGLTTVVCSPQSSDIDNDGIPDIADPCPSDPTNQCGQSGSSAVPEPATPVLFGVALLAACAAVRRRVSKQPADACTPAGPVEAA